jgi:hypothetical protein
LRRPLGSDHNSMIFRSQEPTHETDLRLESWDTPSNLKVNRNLSLPDAIGTAYPVVQNRTIEPARHFDIPIWSIMITNTEPGEGYVEPVFRAINEECTMLVAPN